MRAPAAYLAESIIEPQPSGHGPAVAAGFVLELVLPAGTTVDSSVAWSGTTRCAAPPGECRHMSTRMAKREAGAPRPIPAKLGPQYLGLASSPSSARFVLSRRQSLPQKAMERPISAGFGAAGWG